MTRRARRNHTPAFKAKVGYCRDECRRAFGQRIVLRLLNLLPNFSQPTGSKPGTNAKNWLPSIQTGCGDKRNPVMA